MEIRQMKAVALKWWISLAVIACIGLASGVAFAQNGQGLAAVGAISPANPFPRWYMDRSGLQLGQCLDTTNPADPCVLGIVAGSPAPNVLRNPPPPPRFSGTFRIRSSTCAPPPASREFAGPQRSKARPWFGTPGASARPNRPP